MKYLIPLLFPLLASGQNFVPLEVPVFEDGVPLKNAWAGGLNAPQWASLDLNGDELPDLYAFDRNGDVHLAFLREEGTPGGLDFEYDHFATQNFPELRHFVLFRDFNGDDVPDLFASSFDEFQNGIKVFRGKKENGALSFERMKFPEFEHDVLYHEMDGAVVDQVKVYLASDYPAIDDLDGDGDLDILSMQQSGDKVIFYKNTSLEKGFTMDTLLFELADDCWGKFGIQPDVVGFSLSQSASECAFLTGPISIDDRTPPHGGSTMLTFDYDADGDKEILFGDLIFPSLTFGENGGTAGNAWIVEQDVSFPSGNLPVVIPDFPAAFHLDVDFDGKRDLIASPNLPETSPDQNTVHFYHNEGSDEIPQFGFQTDRFLADGMLDFGTGAAPALADVNADGLLDMVVGNRGAYDGGASPASLALLLNVGTSEEPAFEVTDRDWESFSQYAPDEKAFVPAFGDLDNDGDLDLVVGSRKGNLIFLENMAGPNEPMEFAAADLFWKGIDVGDFAAPFIDDLNQDGKADLVVGQQFGRAVFFPNIGTETNPDFHPLPDEAPNNFFFGEINTQGVGTVVGLCQPVVLNFGEEKQIVTGSFRGWLSRFLVDETKLNGGAFEQLNQRWGELREGRYTRIAFANLNSDDYLEAVIGNDRGGLSIFRSPILMDGTVESVEMFENQGLIPVIFPNPANGEVRLVSRLEVEVSIFDQRGRLVFNQVFPNGTHSIGLWDLPAGSYLVKMRTGQNMHTERVILHGR